MAILVFYIYMSDRILIFQSHDIIYIYIAHPKYVQFGFETHSRVSICYSSFSAMFISQLRPLSPITIILDYKESMFY
jgi:hypothetical protein